MCLWLDVSVCASNCVGLRSMVNNELVPLPIAQWRFSTAIAAVLELPHITAHINQCGIPPHRLQITTGQTPDAPYLISHDSLTEY